MALLQIGPIRLAVLDSGGAKTKTLILPPPSKGGLELNWEEDSSTVTLALGGRRTRKLGYVPTLSVRWKVYDDRQASGIDDGDTPSLEQLLTLLSASTRGLRISPGLSAGGFNVDQAKVDKLGKICDFYEGAQVTFYGRDALASMTLETF